MKIGQKLKRFLGAAAPMLGSAVGGPFGGIAGRFIQDALGVDSDEAALALVETDPEALLKLKGAEQAFLAHMEELGVEREKIAAGDRASAREMAAKTTLLPQIVLGAAYTVGYFAILFLYLTGRVQVDPAHEGQLSTLIGALGGAQLMILTFFFGSSAGSKEKTAKLGNGH